MAFSVLSAENGELRNSGDICCARKRGGRSNVWKNTRVMALRVKGSYGRVEKEGREVRMWKGFKGVIGVRHYYERVTERLKRKEH